jgi:hypothetical protein
MIFNSKVCNKKILSTRIANHLDFVRVTLKVAKSLGICKFS